MHFSFFILCFLVARSVSQSSSTTYTSKYENSTPMSSASTVGSGGDTSAPKSNQQTSTSDSLNLDEVEKLVTYTTKQKTIFIACCGGTFVLLIALAILSGMSDTIARSRQKTKRTHA